MTEVIVLIEGYAREEDDGFYASPTTTLIKDNGLTILVDPGANEKKLVAALEKQGLQPKDIDIVFLSHYLRRHLHHQQVINTVVPGDDAARHFWIEVIQVEGDGEQGQTEGNEGFPPMEPLRRGSVFAYVATRVVCGHKSVLTMDRQSHDVQGSLPR